MKRTIVLACAGLLACPLSAFAFDKNITCESPQGSRVDYFQKNPSNIPLETFHMARDRVSDIHPHLEFKEGEVVFKIVSIAAAAKEPIEATMKIMEESEEQISFSGMMNGAPVMASYYPQIKILIYTQQSVWPSPDFQGARALIMYAKCTEDAQPTDQPSSDAVSSDQTTTTESSLGL